MKSKKWNVLGFVALSATLLSVIGGCRAESDGAAVAQRATGAASAEMPNKPRIYSIRAISNQTEIRPSSAIATEPACMKAESGSTIRFSSVVEEDRGIFFMHGRWVFIEMRINPKRSTADVKNQQGIFHSDGSPHEDYSNCLSGDSQFQGVLIDANKFEMFVDGRWKPLIKVKKLPTEEIP